MANHASALKRIRRNARRAVINGDRRNRVRTYIKKVEAALGEGDAVKAEEAYKVVVPEMGRAVSKGVFHKNMAARKMSRLSARIKSLKNAS